MKFPWKYVRSLLKLGTTTKVLLVSLTIVVPLLLLLRLGPHYPAVYMYKPDIGGQRVYGGPHNTAVFKPGIGGQRVLSSISLESRPDGAGKVLDRVGQRFAKRRQHLLRQCSTQDHYYEAQNSETAVKEHLTIDKKRKLVYCSIEKIGCTFWKRVFQILSGFRNVTDPFQIQAIRAYEGYLTAKGMPFDKIHMILKSSTKFMFVREPYERLLSGYVDKLFAPNAAYWTFIGTFIVSSFRQNVTESSRRCGHDVTFEEFVRYFIYSQETNEKRDAHFVPNFEHCRPCEIDYNYIGKLETFEEDTMFLVKELKLDDKVRFANFEKETEADAIVDAADYVYSMKMAVTRCMTMNEALLRAYRKLQIRGIISNEIPYPLPMDSTRDVGIFEYKQALLAAHARSGSSASRKSNRKMAFLEAYSSLPHDLLMQLKDVLKTDAMLFGYDEFPKSLENLSSFKPTFSYFKI